MGKKLNLHQIVSGAIGRINPFVEATLLRATGYATAADGTQTPTYAAPVTAAVQVQALSSDELKQVEGLNVQGNKQAVYLNGNWSGIVRPDRKGGDLIIIAAGPQAGAYLTITVLENWSSWTKLAVVLQNE